MAVIGYGFVAQAAILMAGHVVAARRKVDICITSLVKAAMMVLIGRGS